MLGPLSEPLCKTKFGRQVINRRPFVISVAAGVELAQRV